MKLEQVQARAGLGADTLVESEEQAMAGDGAHHTGNFVMNQWMYASVISDPLEVRGSAGEAGGSYTDRFGSEGAKGRMAFTIGDAPSWCGYDTCIYRWTGGVAGYDP